MFNSSWVFKFCLHSPVASVIPVISMNKLFHLCLNIRMWIVFCENSNWGSQRFLYVND